MKRLPNRKIRNLILSSFLSLMTLGAVAQNPFVTKWDVNTLSSNGNYEITIPTHHGNQYNYNYDVDWEGDGTFDDFGVTSDINHVYASPGNYIVQIRGNFPAIHFNNNGDKDLLLDVMQWGDIQWTTFASAFSGCSNMTISANDVPNLTEVVDMSYIFHKATDLNVSLNNWNVGTIKYMRGSFSEANSFNGNISDWDVSSVEDMTSMFESATSFNNDISNWSTENLQEMTYIFANAKSFNIDISPWPVGGVTNFNGLFAKATSFNKPLDWELGEVTSMHNTFSGAVKFNQDISGWPTSSVVNMSHMFEGASVFDQDLGDWDIRSVEDMRYMLSASNLSHCNYESTLNGWSGTASSSVTLGSDGLLYFDDSGRNSLVANNWTIKGDAQDKADECALTSTTCHVGTSTFFKTTWVIIGTSLADRTITIPATGTTNNYDVDWNNDGIFDDLNVSGTVSHVYNNAGTKKISIRGTLHALSFWNSPDQDKITSIDQWGCIQWSTFHRAFENCSNVVENATDAPDLSSVTDLSSMFRNATSLTGDMDNWDVSTITNMSYLFGNASSFNGDITSWNTSNATNISNVFHGATVFNQDIGSWDVSSNTSLNGTFKEAIAFNQDIGSWDVSNTTDLYFTFLGATSFNQDLDAWDVSNVTLMVNTFYQATSFNNGDPGNNEANPLDSWDVSNVTDMSSTFRLSAFNQDISSWNTASLVNMYHTFAYNSVFDQDVSAWDVSNVTSLMATFSYSTAFNQDISGWDVSNVSNMYRTFHGASSFNQNLGAWDLSSVGTGTAGTLNSMNLFFTGSGMLLTNYDNTLIGWASNSNTPNSVYYAANGRFYCDADITIVSGGLTAIGVLNSKGWNGGNIATSGHTFDCSAPLVRKDDSFGTSTNSQLTVVSGTGSDKMVRIKSRDLQTNSNLNFKLYDMSGKLMYSGNTSNGEASISTVGFSKGIYLLRIENGAELETKKILVE